jgi:uncharacterized protein YcaQ
MGKAALEYLFWTGEVTVATRRNFERVYDIPQRVVPSLYRDVEPPSRPSAIRQLMRLSADALGIASFTDLRDYFRLPVRDAGQALRELVETGDLMSVRVDGWRAETFVPRDLRLPRRTPPCSALLSPFDPLVWERSRAERLFGFSYRIEIYTPAPQRKFGYYVLPFLHGERFAARVCLKSDRPNDTLRVNAAHLEEGAAAGTTAEALAAELALLADFLHLGKIEVSRRGNLAAAVSRRLQALNRR